MDMGVLASHFIWEVYLSAEKVSTHIVVLFWIKNYCFLRFIINIILCIIINKRIIIVLNTMDIDNQVLPYKLIHFPRNKNIKVN